MDSQKHKQIIHASQEAYLPYSAGLFGAMNSLSVLSAQFAVAVILTLELQVTKL